jgi:beta-glucosidase
MTDSRGTHSLADLRVRDPCVMPDPDTQTYYLCVALRPPESHSRHGLSYTTFAYRNLRLSTDHLAPDGALSVSVDVTNTGARAGDEVVQLYVRHLHSTVERPKKELKGFKRITLQPGETQTVPFPLEAAALAYWDADLGGWQVEPGQVRVMVGASSADIKLVADIVVG